MAGNRADAAGDGPWRRNLTTGAPDAYQGMPEFCPASVEIRESLCPKSGALIAATRQVDSGGISPLRIAKRTRPGTSKMPRRCIICIR
jgi:hypothetical protein